MFNNSLNSLYNIDDSKYVCKCEKCGTLCQVSGGVVLTSNPPQYRYTYACNKCGNVGMVSDVQLIVNSMPHNLPLPEQEVSIKDILQELKEIKSSLLRIESILNKNNLIENPSQFQEFWYSTTSSRCQTCPHNTEVKDLTIGDSPCTFCPDNPYTVTCYNK